MDTNNLNDPELASGWFPYGFWPELCAQLKLALPFSVSMLFHYMIQPISIAFCGHLGKTELAAVAMAISVFYVTVVAIARGLAFGADTFFAQTYGSKNKKNVGVYLQKGIIFAMLWSLPSVGFLLNTENFLLLIKQDPDVARLAQVYLQLFMPGVFAYFCLFMVMRYLLCQNRVIPIMIICIAACGVNIILNYGLVYQADMGIKGSAIALCLTYYLVLMLLVSYIWGMRIYQETWGGWTFKSLEKWGSFFSVTSFSISMTWLFWMCSEVGTFAGGMLSPRDLSAFSITFQTEGFAWILPLGIGGACTARLGQYLGANKPRGAANAAFVALIAVVIVSIAFAAIVYGLRHYIPLAFTTDKSLVNYTADILQLTAIFIIFEGFGGVGVGIIRGTGKQAIGTVIVFVAWYVFAWPIGMPLLFLTKLRLMGLWLGFVIGVVVEDLIITVFVLTFNWKREAEKAVERSKVGVESVVEKLVNADDENEPDETTRLLPNSDQPSTNNPYDDDEAPQTNLGMLICKRLLVVGAFALPLCAGILCRLFVHIDIKAAQLCVTGNSTSNSTISGVSDNMSNLTLPLCNSNDGIQSVYSPFLMYV